jgi:L,D-transpeptidase YcbB
MKYFGFLLSGYFLFLCCKQDDRNIAANNGEVFYDTVKKLDFRPLPIELLDEKSDSIKAYYKTFNDYEIWADKKSRLALIQTIENVGDDGLNPQDFQLDKLKLLEKKRKRAEDIDQFNYDILLTETFEKLASTFYFGKLKPTEVYNNWDLFDRKLIVSQLLKPAIDNDSVSKTLTNLLPQHPQYKALKESLKKINEFEDKIFDSIKTKKKILFNDKTLVIKKIKEKLIFWKDLKQKDTVVTNVFDSEMKKAVIAFQTRHGLGSDGVIGAGTLKALNYNMHTRKDQILANLERWRWFPRDFGKQYILVNLPEYMLNYVIDNDTVATRKVVIGKPERMTPILSSKLSNVVYNPTWTVPPTIIKEDLAVDAAKNRNYFRKRQIQIFNGKNQEINAWQWNPEKANNYRYVQKPGYNNALGLVKFNFPNKHLVYLHDTNHRDYFVFQYRALSSGCVRIENPIAFSKEILKTQDKDRWQKGEIDTIIKKKETYTIKIKQNIYVHQLYWTSWYNKNGLNFIDDVYNLDAILADKLRKNDLISEIEIK